MDEAGERRTQQSRRAETERRLVDAAIELLAEYGLRGLSLAKVGERAGYSRGIVNHHFGTKGALLAAVVHQGQQIDVSEVDGSGLDQLLAIVTTYLGGLRGRASASRAFLLLWSEAVGSEPTLAPLFAERDAWFRELIAGLITRGIDDGSVRGDAEPAALAIAITGLLRGSAMQLLSNASDANPDKVASQSVQLVRAGLAPFQLLANALND